MVSFKDIAGLEMQKSLLNDILLLPLQKKELYAQLVLAPEMVQEQNNFLFSGPPGSGKTYLAEALAHEINMPFTHVRSTELLDSYLGAGAKKIRDLYAKQEGIIFIDEIDAIAQKRSHKNEIKQDVLIELLFCLEGARDKKPYATIAATNRLETLDAAIVSRFTHIIPFYTPDNQQRESILEKQLSYYNTKEINVPRVVAKSEGMDARQLKSLVYYAGITALRDDRGVLHTEDLLRGGMFGYR
jgi:AAA family ATPase